MTKLSEHDWELINAFADGELSDDETVLVERRIAAEPALSEALLSVRQVSSALAVLKPASALQAPAANTNRRSWIWVLGGSLAAAVALVVILFERPRDNRPSIVHQAFLSQNFDLDAGSALRLAQAGVVDGFPSLIEANLTLAITRTDGDIALAHYFGVNGCRLTVFRGTGTAADVTDDVQSAHWTAGKNWFLVVATGMDQLKFIAVADFLRQSTLDRLDQPTVLAMQQTISAALPCSVG